MSKVQTLGVGCTVQVVQKLFLCPIHEVYRNAAHMVVIIIMHTVQHSDVLSKDEKNSRDYSEVFLCEKCYDIPVQSA